MQGQTWYDGSCDALLFPRETRALSEERTFLGMKKTVNMLLLAVLLLAGSMMPLTAHASHCWWDKHGHKHCDQGLHRGWNKNGGDHNNDGHSRLLPDGRSGQIVKGGLLGAGIGAGAGLLLDKPVAKSAVLGAGIGAGSQAIKTSTTMDRHPVAKTAAYGALVGAGASQLTGEGNLGKGALWGGAIGTGVGVLKNSD